MRIKGANRNRDCVPGTVEWKSGRFEEGVPPPLAALKFALLTYKYVDSKNLKIVRFVNFAFLEPAQPRSQRYLAFLSLTC
jgi:hypothetical protein